MAQLETARERHSEGENQRIGMSIDRAHEGERHSERLEWSATCIVVGVLVASSHSECADIGCSDIAVTGGCWTVSRYTVAVGVTPSISA